MKAVPHIHHGGIHPDDCKTAAASAIVPLAVPATISLFVSQHIGAPAKPVVSVNDLVKVGDLVAHSNGFISANIHASASGKVTKVDHIADIDGYKRLAITIAVDGDTWRDDIDRSSALKTTIPNSPDEIIKRIAAAGVVGLGGAAFPSHAKLAVPAGKKIEYLIINGSECEPYLTADHRLMLEKTEELMLGIAILMKVAKPAKVLIGIEDNKPDAIAKCRATIGGNTAITVVPMKTTYPQGGERQLIKTLLNREVPPAPKGLPIDVGCVVYNVGTVIAIYEAVQKNKPLVERVITVTGPHLLKPANLLVRIGTPITHILAAVNGLPEDTAKIIAGGPMMGKAMPSMDTATIKGMSGLMFVPQEQSLRKKPSACIRCGQCVSVCTVGLEPYVLMAEVEKYFYDRAEADGVATCCDCGCCAYICPARRPLLDFIRKGKAVVLKKRRQAQKPK